MRCFVMPSPNIVCPRRKAVNQILAADPCFGCIFSTLQRQAPGLILTNRARDNIAVGYMLKFPLSQKLFRLLAHDQSLGPVELNRQRETLKQTRITCRC